MNVPRKTAIVTGASQGIGAGIVQAFVERDFNVVANSRKVTQSAEIAASDRVALVDGHVGLPATAATIIETALSRFGSVNVLVNNAGIFFTKPFTDYTADDFRSLVSTNLEGFLYVTQLAIKQMLAKNTGGSIVTITAALARNPIRGVPAAVPMITKGGLETVTQHLAMEYAKDGIRVNAVAPGVVYTPLHRETPEDVMKSLSPMGRPSTVKDITDAVLFLTDATTVTGDILYVQRRRTFRPLVAPSGFRRHQRPSLSIEVERQGRGKLREQLRPFTSGQPKSGQRRSAHCTNSLGGLRVSISRLVIFRRVTGSLSCVIRLTSRSYSACSSAL